MLRELPSRGFHFFVFLILDTFIEKRREKYYNIGMKRSGA